jgi:probable F420-dependent oxidoreductase
MKYGFAIPNGGPMANGAGIAALAAKGEALGFDLVYAVDHVVMPKVMDYSRYPYSREFVMATGRGRADAGVAGECLELVGTLAYLAAVTTRLRLLSSIMVLPYRPPVLAAKQLASIDVLSGGRLTIGCGVGWIAEEFDALDAPPFEARGKVANEFIAAFKELWTGDSPSFAGDYVNFSNIAFEPKPIQKPHPPIWVGGESMPAMRRAARLGNGWYPVADNPKFPRNTALRYADGVKTVRDFAVDAGRDPDEIEFGLVCELYDESESRVWEDGARIPFTGGAREIADDVTRYRDAGLGTLVIDFLALNLESTIERMEFFAGEVMPLVSR